MGKETIEEFGAPMDSTFPEETLAEVNQDCRDTHNKVTFEEMLLSTSSKTDNDLIVHKVAEGIMHR